MISVFISVHFFKGYDIFYVKGILRMYYSNYFEGIMHKELILDS